MSHRPRPVEAVGAVDAQTVPTAPWKMLRVFHKLPQGTAFTRSPTKNPGEPLFYSYTRKQERASESGSSGFYRNGACVAGGIETQTTEDGRVATPLPCELLEDPFGYLPCSAARRSIAREPLRMLAIP